MAEQKSVPCRGCGKRVIRSTAGAYGGQGEVFGFYAYARCKPCTRKMLEASPPARFLRA